MEIHAKEYNLINPLKLSQDDMPMVVCEAESNGLFSWLIRARTKGLYNHVMWLIPAGFATQVLTFRIVSIETYLKPNIKLKFFKIKAITPEERAAIYTLLTTREKEPWYKKFYDFLGPIGHFLGIRYLHFPGLDYCSEQVASDISKTLTPIRGKPTPEELEEILKNHPRFEYVGHWIGD